MTSPNENVFLQMWPKCLVVFMGVIELLAVVILFLTELGNVAANFWTTNVFAGGWCGLIMLIHFFALFVAGCCAPGSPAAFRALVITIIALIAIATMISFDAVFIAQPYICILTPSCATNAVSNTTFSYSFQQSFYTVFIGWTPFQSYTLSQAKLLFQTVQLSTGCVCFICCIIYVIIYYVCTSKAKKQVAPSPEQDYYAPQQQSYFAPQQQGYFAPQQQGYYAPQYSPQQQYQPPAPAWRPPQYVPQAQPGAIPWNAKRRY